MLGLLYSTPILGVSDGSDGVRARFAEAFRNHLAGFLDDADGAVVTIYAIGAFLDPR